MSFSDAIGQIDQIIQFEQGLAGSTALPQTSPTTQTFPTTGTTGTATSTGATSTVGTSSTSPAAFADALAQAQASTESSAATGVLDPSDPSDLTRRSPIRPSALDSSDLLGGGDSQLLSALQSATATTHADRDNRRDPGPTVTVNSDSGPAGGDATSAADPRIAAMTEEANALVDKPYVYGGGHDGWGPSKGYDCSGFVSAVIHAGGYLSTPQDTTTLPSASGIESGPGQYVTIYDRSQPGHEGHTIIDINGQFYESGGEHGAWGGGAGVQKISTPSAAYLATFNDVLHPAGL